MPEMKDIILNYIKNEYVEEGCDLEVTYATPLDFGRNRRFVFDGVAQAVPRK